MKNVKRSSALALVFLLVASPISAEELTFRGFLRLMQELKYQGIEVTTDMFTTLLQQFLIIAAVNPITVNLTLIWDYNPEPNVVMYRVYYGTESEVYEQDYPFGGLETGSNSYLMQGFEMQPGTVYYFAVTAVTSEGVESDFSSEVFTQVFYNPDGTISVAEYPSAPGGLAVIVEIVE